MAHFLDNISGILFRFIPNNSVLWRIYSSYSDVVEDSVLLGCHSVYFGLYRRFERPLSILLLCLWRTGQQNPSKHWQETNKDAGSYSKGHAFSKLFWIKRIIAVVLAGVGGKLSEAMEIILQGMKGKGRGTKDNKILCWKCYNILFTVMRSIYMCHYL